MEAKLNLLKMEQDERKSYERYLENLAIANHKFETAIFNETAKYKEEIKTVKKELTPKDQKPV